MVCSTSLIMPYGVDAPAVMPMTLKSIQSFGFSSDGYSTRTLGQFTAQVSHNLAVFELFFPPTTIIPSHRRERESASLCLVQASLHIVSKINKFVYTFFANFSHFSHSARKKVVCETIVIHFAQSSGSFLESSSSSAKLRTTRTSPFACPTMPLTSAWSGFPVIITVSPAAVRSATTRCILATKGQVASA